MKLNATVALTLILLTMMFGAGFVSAIWGFTVGHEALKGVTQPDIRPTNKLTSAKRASGGKDGLDMLREQDILRQVKVKINRGRNSKPEKSSKEDKNKNEKASSEESTQESTTASSQIKLPIKAQDKGVTLQVVSASQQGGSLLLNVSLKNEGASNVRFLYSFLNVTDNKGRALSAITEGLPGELPLGGEEFSGTVSIPTALLNDTQKLNLTLTDYPDQKLQLKMSDIPVVK